MNLLYNIFIMPLETLMRFVLENSYQITGSYGVAVICVSLTFCLGVLPLYIIVDRLQDKEREIQHKMKSKLDEFKSVYKGAVLHAHVKNLYRLHGYHPVYALRSLIGLAIQIPFFIAAYHLLSHHAGMDGNIFLFFDNLAKPDGFLKIAGHSLNIMPFVMTGVNLASAFIYGKKISFKENIQLYVMALVFLVLLYASPSGLLLYWTCNNIFNLLKNIAYRIFSTKKHHVESGEVAREKISIKVMITGVRTGFTNFKNILFLNYGTILTSFVLIMLYLFLGYLPDVKKPTVLSEMIISAFALIVFIMNVYLLGITASDVRETKIKGLSALTKMKLVISFSVLIVLSILYLSTYFHLYGKHIYSVRLFIVISGLLSVIASTFIINRNKSKLEKYKAPASKKKIIPIAECILFLFFFCCFIPSVLFLPSAEDLGGDISNLAVFVLKAVLLFSVLLTGALFIFRKRFGVLAETIIIFILIGIIFGYVYQKDFGIMRGLRFVNESPLSVNAVTVLIDILIIAIITAAVKKLYNKYRKEALICLVLVFAVQSAVLYISHSGSPAEDFVSKNSNADNEAAYSQKEKQLLSDFSFSKDKDNILVMFLDGFPGFLASDLIKKYPEYVKEMSGFIFYRNTVAAGSFTFPSTPAMLGGHKCEIDKLNAESEKSYAEKFNNVLLNHVKYFTKNGFKAAYYDLPLFSNWNEIKKEGGSVISRNDLICFRKKHGEPYKTKNAEYAFDADLDNMKNEKFDEKTLMKLCLFKVLPYLHKHQVYYKTDKLFGNGIQYDDKEILFRYVLSDSMWSSLPSTINDTSDIPTIKWIYSTSMLRPYHINKFGGPAVEENRKGNFNTGGYNEVFMTANYEFELLLKTIKRMKELNIYDNTTIILVADHGVGYTGNWHDSAINPLLMIKERNAGGNFRISDKLMSNADIHAITTYIASKKSDDIIDNPLLSDKKRTVKYFATKHGNPSDLKNNVIEIDFVREVSDTVIGKYSWPSIFNGPSD